MYRENSEALTGNERFEGYNVDLIDEVAKILGFNYTIKLVDDDNYGSYNSKTKTWNGMIGELLSQVNYLIITIINAITMIVFRLLIWPWPI